MATFFVPVTVEVQARSEKSAHGEVVGLMEYAFEVGNDAERFKQWAVSAPAAIQKRRSKTDETPFSLLPVADVAGKPADKNDSAVAGGQNSRSAVSDEQHVRILKAYLSRMKKTDLVAIVESSDSCWREQLNGNAGSQSAADRAFEAVVEQAIGNMIQHDRELVSEILTREMTQAQTENGCDR